MEVQEIEGLKWPRPAELREIAKSRLLTSEELLALKSRTFYVPAKMAKLLMGKDEVNKEEEITVTYNVDRFEDTIEDANPKKLDAETKRTLINEFNYILNEVRRRRPSQSIDDIVVELANLSARLRPAVMDEDEDVFVSQAGKGILLEDMRYLPGGIKDAIYMGAVSMAAGMTRFLLKGKIDTMQELRDYCGYVAGDVGVALNGIVAQTDKVKLSDEEARKLGETLQEINVMKNIRGDWVDRRTIYLPHEIIEGVTHEELFDPQNSRAQEIRNSALEVMIKEIRAGIGPSTDYILNIPQHLTGYLGFAMIPLLAATETIRTIEERGPEETFTGKEVKISLPTFMNIAKLTYSLEKVDGGASMKEFMRMYRRAHDEQNYDIYRFTPEKFDVWSKKLFEE